LASFVAAACIFGTSATIFVLHYFPSLTEHNHEHGDEKSVGHFGARGALAPIGANQ
jgi:hypothetical protein